MYIFVPEVDIPSKTATIADTLSQNLKGGPEPSILDDFCLGNVISKYFSKLRFGTS